MSLRTTAAWLLSMVLAVAAESSAPSALAAPAGVAPVPAGSLAAAFSEHGAIRSLVWHRPGREPVNLVFRQDQFAGFSWHVEVNGSWMTQLPLVRVQRGRDEFALKKDGILYSLSYVETNGVLEVVARIKNDSGKVFAPDRALVNIGLDTEMASYPSWNERFFPTLLRCEKTHFWGYFMRPDGVLLGIASPDPVVSWAHGYNGGGHRLFTSCLDLFNQAPQPARHPQVHPTLAPGEVRQWKIFLVPMEQLAEVQPVLSRVAGIPMIALDRTTVEAGQKICGTFYIEDSPAVSLTVSDPDGRPVAATSDGSNFSFVVGKPGIYPIHLKSADGKIAEALAACRMPWSWYIKQARANAVSKPQKGGSHVEEWMGLFSGYIARRYFPDATLDAAIDAKYAELAPLLYDMHTMLPSSVPDRVQNHSYWASMLVDRYRATGDIHSLEFAASMADFVIKHQTPDGAYRAGYGMGAGHYSCVGYVVKSIMEVMAVEKPLAEKDPAWRARYDRHAASVRLAIDDLVRRKDNIGTEGEATYEDGMIACDFTQLAMYALLQTNPLQREKYLEASKTIALGHRCLSQILIPDCRMNGGSLRYWESQYDILTYPDMMSSPHGWSAWQLYGLWYLYQVTGEKEYLREAMNGLSSCAQLVDFKTGDLRWGFIVDPYVRADVYEQDPNHPGSGIGKPRVIGEQYMPMISGWHRAKPHTWVFGYGRNPNGGSCDNDVHEIFQCLGEIALTSAYVVENADGSLETWNCKARRTFGGTIVVTPAEAVVSRVHFNLKKPVDVRVAFASGQCKGSLRSGMTWFGPDGVPEDIAATVPSRTSDLCRDWSFVREDAKSVAAWAEFMPAEADLVTKGTFPKGVAPQIIRCTPRTARYVCLETLSSYQGPYASVAEFDLLDEKGNALNRQNWKVVYADSEEVGSGDLAANAIDGNPQTKWHTQWTDAAPVQPHALVIDLHAPVRFAGFRYLPRQDGNTSGMTKDWKLFARTEPFRLPAKDETPPIPRNAKWETVCLPHSPKIESPAVNGNYFRGGCWYRREIVVDPTWAGRRVSLQFDGAMQRAVIFVNGVKIETHLGGYLPFVVDLTPYLAGQDRVTVALHLDNNASPAFPPGSNRIDFTYQGGLYRPVHLIVTDPVHISNAIEADRVAGGGVFVQCESADKNQAVVLAKTDIKNHGDESATVSVEHVLLAPDGREVARQIVPGKTLAAGADEQFTSTMAVIRPQLWHPDHPWLYTLVSTVKKNTAKKNGVVCDEVKTRCGLRRLAVTDDGFFLNGENLVFRGANRHMSYPWLGNAGSDNLQYRDIRLLKEGGFNFVRLCHYPQSSATMDACDELGVMALVCTPGWQFFADSEPFKNEAKKNIRTMVRWHRNHPSAVLWEVSLNETYGHDSFYEECSNIAKAEYPGGQLLTGGDSYAAKRVAFYDIAYSGWGGSYSRPHHPDARYKKSLHREYGDMDLPWSVHVVERNSESLMALQAWNFQWSHNKNLSLPWTIGDVIWEGIDTPSAFGPSYCGPLDIYRLPKLSYYFFQSQRNPAVQMTACDSGPMVHIAGFWTERPSPTKVVVYSNGQEVELFLNGKSIGKQRPDHGPDAGYGEYNFQADPTWANKKDPLIDTQKADALAKARAKSNAGRIFDAGNCLHLDHAPFTFVPVAYEPGELKAVVYIDGRVVATNILRTPGKAVALRLRAATLGKPLRADGADAVFVYAEVVDATGEVVPENKPVVEFKAKGAGRLIMPAASGAMAGIAPMFVQAANKPGIITVTATAEGLLPATLELRTEACSVE